MEPGRWEGLAKTDEGKEEVQYQEQEAGEVEVPPGKHLPPHAALLKHNKEHNNKISTHKVIHAVTLTVKFPPNDTAPNKYNPPPPPPICDMTQIPQVGPIKKHSDKHDEEHNER
jgi:hypothetical protein